MAKAKKKEVLLPVEEQPYQIPENWYWTRIENISEIVSKGTTPKGGKDAYIEEGVKFLRVENFLDDGTISHEGIAHVAYDVHESFLKRSILQENDVLVSIAGTLGKTAIIQKEDLPINTNQAVAFIRINPKMKVLPTYLRYLLANPAIQNHLLGKTKVTSIPNLTLEIISSCPVPVPPLAEQQRIVEQIESLFAKLDEAKEKAYEIVEKFESVERSILYAAFTGELTKSWRLKNHINRDTWSEITLQDACCMKITDGTHKTPTYCDKEEGGVPFISAKDVTTKKICWDNIKYIVPELHEELYARLAPQRDDVLLAKNGTTGVAAIVEDERVFDLYVTLALLRPNKSIINPRYLLNIVNSPVCKTQFDEHLTGIGVPNLHLRDIKDVRIPLPSLEEQEEIIRIVDSLLSKEKRAFELAGTTIENIEVMKKTVLAKAFHGELGTNNPDEESAVELLKQILAKDL